MPRVLVIAALTAMTLAACGGADDGTSGSNSSGNGDSTETVDACELLTAAEVEAAVGNPVDAGLSDVGNSCNWRSDGGFYANVRVLAGPNQDQCVDALDATDFYTEARGVGDGAFTFSGMELGGTAGVVVCRDQSQLEVSVYGRGDPPDTQRLRSAADDLARIALGRL